VIGGWSLGGMAAQALTPLYRVRVSHAVLIGSVPPGKNAQPAEYLFFDTALKCQNDIKDETILSSERSRR
jgi:pimeloyl-ACP methyl ester carboxylesterase